MIRLMVMRGGWMAVIGVVGLWLVTAAALAQTPPPVVSPTDISTPTPILAALPTPTASPQLPEPQTASSSAAQPIHDTPYRTLTGAVLTYTVQAGDTVLSVALEMGIDFDEVPCSVGPTFQPEQPLVIGDVLSAPPANMICHEVLPGETVASIAAAYFIDPEQIRLLPWNQLIGLGATEPAPHTHVRVPFLLPGALLPGASLHGEQLSVADDELGASALSDSDFLALMLNLPVDTSPFVVFAQKGAARRPATSVVGPVPADWPYGSGDFAWPVYGWLSQSYRYDHRAIDVAAPQGSPVTAADRGVVLRAGWNNQGYGRFVIIDHKIDYITLYAHLDRVLVEEGEVVGKGQVIGTVGSTGNSTGPHLHFEIRDFGRLANPLELLAAP